MNISMKLVGAGIMFAAHLGWFYVLVTRAVYSRWPETFSTRIVVRFICNALVAGMKGIGLGTLTTLCLVLAGVLMGVAALACLDALGFNIPRYLALAADWPW